MKYPLITQKYIFQILYCTVYLLSFLLFATSCRYNDYLTDLLQYRDITIEEKLFSVQLLSIGGSSSPKNCRKNLLFRNSNEYLHNVSFSTLDSGDPDGGVVTFQDRSLLTDCSLSENGGFIEIEVTLNRNIREDLKISIDFVEHQLNKLNISLNSRISLQQQVKIEPQALFFKPSTWNIPQSFRISLSENWSDLEEQYFRVILATSFNKDFIKILNYQTFLFCSSLSVSQDDCYSQVDITGISALTLNFKMLESHQSIQFVPLFDSVPLGKNARFRLEYNLLAPVDVQIVGIRDSFDSEEVTDLLTIDENSVTSYQISNSRDLIKNSAPTRLDLGGMEVQVVFKNLQRLWNYPLKDFILDIRVSESNITPDDSTSLMVNLLGGVSPDLRDSILIFSKITLENPNVARVLLSSANWMEGVLSATTFLVEGSSYSLDVFLSSIPYDDTIIRFEIPDEYVNHISIFPKEVVFTRNSLPRESKSVQLHLLESEQNTINNIAINVNVISEDIFYMQHDPIVLTSPYVDTDSPSVYYQLTNGTYILDEGSHVNLEFGVTIPLEDDLNISFDASFFNISDITMSLEDDMIAGFIENTESILNNSNIRISTNSIVIPRGFSGMFNMPLKISFLEDDIQFPNTNYRIGFSLDTEDLNYQNIFVPPIYLSIVDNDQEIEELRSLSISLTSLVELGCSDTLNSITRDINFGTPSLEDGVTLSWTSSNPLILSDDGTLGATLELDEDLYLNARLSKNQVFVDRTLDIRVLSQFKRFSSGCGTKAEPYLVRDLNDLLKINFYLTSHFLITNDIDARETKDWTNCSPNVLFSDLINFSELEYCQGFPPIGLVSALDVYHMGAFSGSIRSNNGFNISNLFMKARLRGRPNIVNLLLSWGFLSVLSSSGEITNIKFTNLKQIVELIEIPFSLVGGILGRSEGNINALEVLGSVEVFQNLSDILQLKLVGGIVGVLHTDSGKISNSVFVGDINNYVHLETALEKNNGPAVITGGLIGSLENSAMAENIYSGGTVNSTCVNCWDILGGLVGRLTVSSRLDRGYSYMSVSSNGGNFVYLGGLVGRGSRKSFIDNSFATNQISGIGSFISIGGAVSWGGDFNIYNTYANGYYQAVVQENRNEFKIPHGVYTGCLIGRALGEIFRFLSSAETFSSSAIEKSSGHCFQNVRASSLDGNKGYPVYLGGLVGFSEATILNTYGKVEFDIYSNGNTVNQGGISGIQRNTPITHSYAVWNTSTVIKGGALYHPGGLASVLHSNSTVDLFLLNSSYVVVSDVVDLAYNQSETAKIDVFSSFVTKDNLLRCPQISNDSDCTLLYNMWSSDIWDFGNSSETPILRNSDTKFLETHEIINGVDFRWLNSSYELEGVTKVLISEQEQRKFAMINQMFSDVRINFEDEDSFESVRNSFTLELTQLSSFVDENVDWSLSVESNFPDVLIILENQNTSVSVGNPSTSLWVSIKVLLTYRKDTSEEYHLEKNIFFYVPARVPAD